MRKFLRFPACLALFILLAGAARGQKKELTYEQIFKAAPSGLLNPLPSVIGWTDDDHFLITQKDDSGKLHPFTIDVKTGTKTATAEKNAAPVPSPAVYYHLSEKEKNITASPDGKWVAFTRNNDLYAKELSTGKEIQFSRDGSDNIYNGYAAWLYYEEILGRASHYKAFWWSPDSKHIAYMHFDETRVPVFPIFGSEGQHGYLEKQHYPKAGDPNPAVKVGITSVDNPQTTWADFNEADDQYFGTPQWTPDGSALWVFWMPRSQQELKIFSVNPASGSKKIVYDETQKTWIDLDLDDRVQFVPGDKYFILKSDRTGWMHLYLHNMDGSLANPLTQGTFTVTELVSINEKEKRVYFKARKENSARFDLYRVDMDGKGLKRLSTGDYSYDAIVSSPHSKYFICTYSNLSTPSAMELIDNNGKLIREVANSKGPSFDEYELSRTELVRIKSRDGLFELPMTITYPIHFDPSKKYPVLISIYGGPNAGTVFDRWNRGFLTAQWWAREGMIQVAMDNRSSGHFGKEGMNYIYRQLGKFEIEDYMDCARWLRTQAFVDSSRICITGGSFGGYITCMALTYGADVFTHGLANYSVTDWALYDSHYTERYMGEPKDNAEGYKITSPQTYVKQYRGLIRITHGNMDNNVHMQNSIQLINKLEDLDKNFEFMIYPGERHGWGGLKAVHLRNESSLFIYNHLLGKPMPDIFWK